MRASVSTVPLKPPPAHLRVTSTGPWLAGTALEVAAWLGVPDGDEDTQRDNLRNIEREGIDVEATLGLTEANLKELGFRMGDRLKIRQAQQCGAVAVTPRTTPIATSEPVTLCLPTPSGACGGLGYS